MNSRQRITAILICVTAAARAGAAEESLDFDRDVRPLLAEKCFVCHGPGGQKAGTELRLDRRDAATKPGDDGCAAIMPGRPEDSALVRRIFSADPDVVMPPPKSKQQLTAAQKQLLSNWIAQGATNQPHWSLVPPKKSALPDVRDPAAARHAVDRFVLRQLDDEDVSLSREAPRHMLVRRLTLDLTGLPPSPEDAAAFAADDSPDAFERLADRLFASPHFGER